jgi:3-hydroxyacyl-CoA dehydrogenase/enoyl-CoA hydratase/3-hydroxybutyryl-CoA epimerase
MTTTTPALETQSPARELVTAVKEMPVPMDCVHRSVTENGLCVLTFDRPNSPANIFDKATLLELNGHLSFVASNPGLKGLVLTSAKKSIFIAGADIKSFMEEMSPDGLRDLIELGQSVFNRIAALPIPTVASIHGACLGGGYEIALACDYRIASSDKATRIGLPETMLGILPAWGGSTRLPRLIGVPKALDVILGGKALAAKPALRCGMVDELVPKECLVDIACRRILSRGEQLRHRKQSLKLAVLNNGLVARLIARKARAEILKKTRGHYPAVEKALDVVVQGISKSVPDSLALEREAILQLGRTETSKNLVRIFFLQERAKKLSVPGKAALPYAETPVKRLAVVGAGVMGAGIAQWASSRQVSVILRDINAEQVSKGLATIAKLYQEGVKRYRFTSVEARAGMDNIFPAPNDVSLHNVDLVIEAAIEKMPLKKDIFCRLDELAGPQTILATNTSALSVSEIASATKRPERVVGIHFFNPVHRMQLVEVVVGKQTHPDVVRRAVKFVQQIGKLPVIVKDSPGFLVNRILMPYLIEAGHLFECGARVEDIDETMLDFGMPMGPLRLIDEVGLDVAHHVSLDLASKFSDRLQTPRCLGSMMEAKLLGKKSGAGFYLHQKGSKEPKVNPDINKFHDCASCANLSREELRSRMVLLMVNEAARCLEEEIVSEPADVDFGMIMGTGFAPFRGGPLRFTDSIGARAVVAQMETLAEKGDGRFAPCALLKSMSESGKKFYEN